MHKLTDCFHILPRKFGSTVNSYYNWISWWIGKWEGGGVANPQIQGCCWGFIRWMSEHDVCSLAHSVNNRTNRVVYQFNTCVSIRSAEHAPTRTQTRSLVIVRLEVLAPWHEVLHTDLHYFPHPAPIGEVLWACTNTRSHTVFSLKTHTPVTSVVNQGVFFRCIFRQLCDVSEWYSCCCCCCWWISVSTCFPACLLCHRVEMQAALVRVGQQLRFLFLSFFSDGLCRPAGLDHLPFMVWTTRLKTSNMNRWEVSLSVGVSSNSLTLGVQQLQDGCYQVAVH